MGRGTSSFGTGHPAASFGTEHAAAARRPVVSRRGAVRDMAAGHRSDA